MHKVRVSNQHCYTKHPKKTMPIHCLPSLSDKRHMDPVPLDSGYNLTPETLKPCVAMVNSSASYHLS